MLTLKSSEKKVLKKYKNLLTNEEIKRIIELSRDSTSKFEEVIDDFIENKYNVKVISGLLDKGNGSGNISEEYKNLLKDSKISKKKLNFIINKIKFYMRKRRSENFKKNGRITKAYTKRADRTHLKKILKHKLTEHRILLNPGPVTTSLEVKNAIVNHDICHRDSDFEKIMENLKKNSLKIFDADGNYSTVFISGSGTSGVEAAISSTIPPDKKLMVISNGVFGERIAEIVELHNISMLHIKKKWGDVFNLEEMEGILKSNPDIFGIAMVHHETSIGILNPISSIGKLSSKYGKVFIVDAISSLGAEDLSVRKDNIDICITSSNKCLHSFSGVTVICINNRIWNLIENVKPRVYYLDLKKYYNYSKSNQTPYTPFVASFFALDKAIQELLEEGIEQRKLKYRELNFIMKLELSKLGFEFFTNTGSESRTILTVKMPEGINFKKMYELLKQRGFIIYDSKPPLQGKYFQIANMGAINKKTVYNFIFTLKEVLRELRGGRK